MSTSKSKISSIGLELNFKKVRTIFGWKDQNFEPALIMIVSTSILIIVCISYHINAYIIYIYH